MRRPAIHPGEILRDEISTAEITPTELARQLQVPHNRIAQILQKKRPITGDTALRLGHWFEASARFWLMSPWSKSFFKSTLIGSVLGDFSFPLWLADLR